MKLFLSLSLMLACLFGLNACEKSQRLSTSPVPFSILHDGQSYFIMEKNDLIPFMAVLLDQEVSAFKRISFGRAEDPEGEFSVITAHYVKGEQFFSAVMPLDEIEGADKNKGKTFEAECLMSCTSSSYCENCTHEIVARCKVLSCNCEDNGGCRSTVAFF